jgi:hypothetical protein
MSSLNVIAKLRTCYTDKFGVPRQSGIVPAAWGVIEFIRVAGAQKRCGALRSSVIYG